MGFLLLFPQTALEAASSGLVLWYRNLVPVLLPFLILSNLLIRLDIVSSLLKYICENGVGIANWYDILQDAGILFAVDNK